MFQPPTFFVPEIASTFWESRYRALAEFAHQPVADMKDRVFEIRFVHKLEEVWTATVGEPLYGTHVDVQYEAGSKVVVRRPLADRAIVLAIFPGRDSYVAVTNDGDPVKVGSIWPNPFWTEGLPKRVVRFSLR